MKNTKKLVLLAIMVSQALVLSLVESWIPVPTFVYGIKLGLANIVTLVVIVFFGFKDALLVVLVRCALAALFGGGFVVFLFSITGGILSTIVMSFLFKKLSKVFSLIGISIAGAVTHNLGQIIIAILVMKTLSVAAYLPVLLVSGVVMGCFVGLCSSFLCTVLRRNNVINQ
ncbi:MAG: Gx transporter family protein [Clostridia bacterium]|nr:Gx transporter family protein [Clostridia bacterium]